MNWSNFENIINHENTTLCPILPTGCHRRSIRQCLVIIETGAKVLKPSWAGFCQILLDSAPTSNHYVIHYRPVEPSWAINQNQNQTIKPDLFEFWHTTPAGPSNSKSLCIKVNEKLDISAPMVEAVGLSQDAMNSFWHFLTIILSSKHIHQLDFAPIMSGSNFMNITAPFFLESRAHLGLSTLVIVSLSVFLC